MSLLNTHSSTSICIKALFLQGKSLFTRLIFSAPITRVHCVLNVIQSQSVKMITRFKILKHRKRALLNKTSYIRAVVIIQTCRSRSYVLITKTLIVHGVGLDNTDTARLRMFLQRVYIDANTTMLFFNRCKRVSSARVKCSMYVRSVVQFALKNTFSGFNDIVQPIFKNIV